MTVPQDSNAAPPDPTLTKQRKIADRPHNLTLFTSISALIISVGGLILSITSYQSSSRTAAANLALSEEVQSAYLESDLKLETRLADFDRGSRSSRAKPVQLVFFWTLRNSGNTAATRVISNYEAHFIDLTASRTRSIGDSSFSYKMEKHTKQDLPIVLELAASEFALLLTANARVEITGQLRYTDIFKKNHILNWTAFLENGRLTVRQY